MKATTGSLVLKQRPKWARIAIFAAAVLAFFAALAAVPLPIPAYLDFQVLYQTAMGLLRGISPYDHAGQVQMIAQLANVQPEHVYVLPFPYPPWYALSMVWLAWLPIETAARLWLGISVGLLLLSAWLLTDGWRPTWRLLSFVFAILFVPVLGSLFVGQYGFPVLLGAALMMHALRHERPLPAALAAVLLTFKPHLGGLILLAALVYLWQRRDAFAGQAFTYLLWTGAALIFVGFMADRAWPLTYVRSLLDFQKDPGVATCGLCASLPVWIASTLSRGTGLPLALGIGVFILVTLTTLWIRTRRATIHDPLQWMTALVLIVMLASPYLLNYDFILLLLPLFVLAGQPRKPTGWIVLGGAYLMPFLALGVLGRQGNFIYPFAAIILLVMLYRDTRSTREDMTA